jgi:hypothetical protein
MSSRAAPIDEQFITERQSLSVGAHSDEAILTSPITGTDAAAPFTEDRKPAVADAPAPTPHADTADVSTSAMSPAPREVATPHESLEVEEAVVVSPGTTDRVRATERRPAEAIDFSVAAPEQLVRELLTGSQLIALAPETRARISPVQETSGMQSEREQLDGAPDGARALFPKPRATAEEQLLKPATAEVEPGQTNPPHLRKPESWPRPPASIQFQDLGPAVRELLPTNLRRSDDAADAREGDPSASDEQALRKQSAASIPLAPVLEERASTGLVEPRNVEATRLTAVVPGAQHEPSTRAAAQNQLVLPRGAESRLTINRLDIQIINQPVAPIASPPPLPPPASNLWDTLDRHHLGNAGLML